MMARSFSKELTHTDVEAAILVWARCKYGDKLDMRTAKVEVRSGPFGSVIVTLKGKEKAKKKAKRKVKDDKVVNLTDKPITEFVPGDTIYIKKMKGGFGIIYLCRFVSFERGIVTGDVISCEPKWACSKHEIKKGVQLRARLSKCYLWGLFADDELEWNHCHWFDPKTKKVIGK